MFILDSLLKAFHVVCQIAPALPSAQLALQTNMERHHPIFDLHNKVYGKKHKPPVSENKFDFPRETGIEYETGRGLVLLSGLVAKHVQQTRFV